MPALRQRFKVTLDERTDTMAPEVLLCRSMNHPWQRVPLSTRRRNELLKVGQTETTWFCLRCGSQRIDVFELPTFATVSTKYVRCEGYDIAPAHRGTGRLPRLEARKALFVRDMPELV